MSDWTDDIDGVKDIVDATSAVPVTLPRFAKLQVEGDAQLVPDIPGSVNRLRIGGQSGFHSATGTIASTTLAVICTVSLTTAAANRVFLIDFAFNGEITGPGTDIAFRLRVDGATVRDGALTTSSNAGNPSSFCFCERRVVASAGVHTVEVLWAVENGSDTASAAFANLRVQDVAA